MQLLQVNPFGDFALSEPRLRKNILNPELQVPGYTFVRNDCSIGRRGGGLMAFVRDVCVQNETFSVPRAKKAFCLVGFREPGLGAMVYQTEFE